MPDPTTLPAAVPDAAPPAPPQNAMARVMARTVGGVAVIAAIGAGIGWTMGGGWVPPLVATHGVAIGIAAVGGVMAVRWVRRGVRRQLRDSAAAQVAEFGGGLYGSLAFATLLYLEAMDVIGDVADAGSLGTFVGRIDVGWLMGQMMESIGFAIQAAMWPWHWFSEMGPAVAGLVAGGVWALHGILPKLWRRGAVAGAEQTP